MPKFLHNVICNKILPWYQELHLGPFHVVHDAAISVQLRHRMEPNLHRETARLILWQCQKMLVGSHLDKSMFSQTDFLNPIKARAESLCGLQKYFQIRPNSLKCLLQAI